MDALRSPPPSASSFTFPSSPAHASTSSPSSSSKLAAAFDYPVRQDSLAHAHRSHNPSTSTSTASSSSSSRGRGHAYASTSSSSAGTRSAYTSCTSDAFDEGPDCEDEDEGREYSDAGSVLDELYDELAAFHPLAGKDNEASPPRGYGRTDSTALLRERTRYRSSASYSPTQALNLQRNVLPGGAFGTLSFEQRDSQLSLLASIAASPSTPLDRCFCGNEAEEDSIYCGRACAQADALNALCGGGSAAGSSGVEDGAGAASSSSSSSDGASLRSGTSGGMAESGSESHYRRVEREAERRAKERERQARREKKAGRKLGRSEAAARLEGRAQAEEEEERERVVRPPPRTTSRPPCTRTSSRTGTGTPSLSSSVSSLASSAQPSPISPCFPSTAAAPESPFIIEPTSSPSGAFEPPLRPCTPNPPSSTHLANDIYSSYLTATPLASDKLRTPRGTGTGTPGSTLVTPRATFPRTPGADGDEEEGDESPTQRGGGAEGVGLRMLELCADDEDEDEVEERDQVSPDPDEGGWGAQEMRERMWARSGSARSSAYGHTKGKLSFEDVVGILGA
ncbi:hypothetical protein OF846_004933 [Rhodotorula toruloides]|nr:hypothetical protein OF846_004933 [Rhodotorula toruloides]